MKFSFQWLSEYVDPGRDPAEAGARLTAVGIPMDSLETIGGDAVLDLDISANRPDCMSHLGLARELTVATGRPLQEPDSRVSVVAGRPEDPSAELEVVAADLCGRYTARVILDVRVGPSPDWMSRRLRAIGLRPVNSIVDATNYVLWEMGHPLHAFDLARLEGRKIVVRRARPGEPITTLDGIGRQLDPETLVIADARRPVAVAGVMGGLDSEISPSTTGILLESAHFHPASVRRAARRLGLHTDASHRFERGADPEITQRAADRCARLIAEVAGGRVLATVLDRRAAPPRPRTIDLRPQRVQSLLGLAIPAEEMKRILERLGCSVASGESGRWQVSPPSFRGDLTLEADLIEEIARHHGYDRIPTSLPAALTHPEGRPAVEKQIRRVRETMVRAGLTEAMNLSIVTSMDNESLGAGGPGVRVTNPLVEGQDRLRASLLPGLLRNLAHNLNRGGEEVRLFEVGHVFRPARGKESPVEEEESLALLCAGRCGPKHWSRPVRPPDLFDLKGALDLAGRRLGLPPLEWTPADRPFLASGSAAEIRLSARTVGVAGEVERTVAAAYGLAEPVLVAEVSLGLLFASIPAGYEPRYASLPRTPFVSRDLSLILDEHHTYAEVEATIRSVEGAPITRVSLFDRYRGRPVPSGKVSLAVQIVFQDPERTLVSEAVAEFLERIVQRLRDRLGAELRGN